MTAVHPQTELLLIRHAESEWNASGRWQGQADPPLSGAGRQQADSLAAELLDVLAGQRLAALVCSDLQRAHETARLVGDALGIAARPDPRLRELDVGLWAGLTRSEIELRDGAGLAGFESGDPDLRPGGGETRREIRARAHAAIESLAAGFEDELVIVVSHLGFLRALVPDIDPRNAQWLRMGARDALSRRVQASVLGPAGARL